MELIKVQSQEKLRNLIEKLKHAYPQDNTFHKRVCIYACGSLGRLEMAENSDLDLFFIIMNSGKKGKEELCSNIEKYNFFSKLHDINKNLAYKEPSKNGIYWDFISQDKLLDIGSREEDFNNSFTARMLLLLESKPLYNEKSYNRLVNLIVKKYFIDYKGHSETFYPLYLMNDILRYLYTLTMNYEYRRDSKDSENDKNWKRLKLKYARLITCFSMIACLYRKTISPEYVISCIKKTPFERLKMLPEHLENVKDTIYEIETKYKWFIELKKENEEWWNDPTNKKRAIDNAESFHHIVVHELMKNLSHANPELHKKADSY